ncbi:bifunctional cobalt-precorrin-7 (C(5))-methyltransferase/cobalt-precorrin-6B (C(15))-methyltransferase [Papillibacter cinnamivorans]|uniref:Precorrin-6Y C5,15-methyltransferase (Decarboxylating) n=1 Tax=Papillibacter cinnamivorans DSM 12816 TaxID=1122930 RepID=A0A1W2CNT8_9FIRM|nr:precorrin-6B methylase [Papillibacter cinnamivorans]SMC86879.1 precorrin-6Y C5,15-methyltransferase (decarboxylating) [Papillibacter cinnamivorans DSM 12816]
MEQSIFTNEVILSWLQYFSKNLDIQLSKIKLLDITGENKNLIPAVMSSRAVLVFTDAGHPDIFYDMWNAELGDCDIWYNEGSSPTGEIKHNKLSYMINRGINASAAMLILNPNAAANYQIGMENSRFSCGSVHYVCREVRAVIMSKLNLGDRDNICVISGESIAVEAAMIASGGSVVAVEYDSRDYSTMKANAEKFGLNNVSVVQSLEDDALKSLPAPDIAFIVASPRLGWEIKRLLAMNPSMRFVIYTLDFEILSSLSAFFLENGLERTETIHIAVSRVNSKNMLEPFPAPWLISGRGAAAK